MNKKLKIFAAGGLVLAVAASMVYYWWYSTLHPSTQDALLKANVVHITAQVTGKVTSVEVVENQKVAKGDLLFQIDPRDYSDALNQAKAALEEAKAQQSSIAAQVKAEQVAIHGAQTSLTTASRALARAKKLYSDGTVSQSVLDQATSTAALAQSAVQSARARLSQAQTAQITNLATIGAVQAKLNEAELNLERTKIYAPAEGWVAHVTLVKGSTVMAYVPQFALIDSSQWWVTANFKEADLARIKQGQPATVTVDMLPGVTLKGHVQSLGYGSGSTFSLLPPQNATGNWIKVVQRFPIRIVLDEMRDDLRVGASSSVRVNTTVNGKSSKR